MEFSENGKSFVSYRLNERSYIDPKEDFKWIIDIGRKGTEIHE